ncbi:MAG: nucleotidyltransferase domain-containing protein [Chitinivibrionales bacterium]|nr:nucleotidyltransferase domain-containing protein [Chitinivibrionales bacterium]
MNIPEKVNDTVLSIEPDAQIILFGSQARGEGGKESDWDFLVLVDGPVDCARTDRIRHALYEIEWDTGEIISSRIRSRGTWYDQRHRQLPLHRAIEREGIVI